MAGNTTTRQRPHLNGRMASIKCPRASAPSSGPSRTTASPRASSLPSSRSNIDAKSNTDAKPTRHSWRMTYGIPYGQNSGTIAHRRYGERPLGAPPATPPYLATFPNFAPILTPQLPGDVDTTLKTTLENAGLFPRVQREFDLNAWQMFLAVNWPTSNQNRPALRITDTSVGAPR